MPKQLKNILQDIRKTINWAMKLPKECILLTKQVNSLYAHITVTGMRLNRFRKQEAGASNKWGVAGENQEVKQEAYKTY